MLSLAPKQPDVAALTLLLLTRPNDSIVLKNEPSPILWGNERLTWGICSNWQLHLLFTVFQDISLIFYLATSINQLLIKNQNKVQTWDFMLCQCKACKLIPEGKWHIIPGEIWILPCTRESVLTSWLWRTVKHSWVEHMERDCNFLSASSGGRELKSREMSKSKYHLCCGVKSAADPGTAWWRGRWSRLESQGWWLPISLLGQN